MFAERRVSKLVKRARCGIALELTVPLSRVEFGEPLTKSGELLRRESRDFLLQFLNLGHVRNIAKLVSLG